jgi:DNA polymerase-3 subunit gamma/tau
MLSQHSFNALLKTLEEPPPHVKFLLATTDPQKLPVTVLSRCLQFNLKRLSLERIVERLQLITDKEGIAADAPALRLLGKAAEGSMRDALSLLDQAIAFGGGEVRETDTRTMLGTIDSQHVVKVLDALASGDAEQLMQQAAALAEDVPDYEGVLVDIASLLQKIAIFQVVPDTGLVEEELQTVQELAPRLSPEDVQLYYQIAIQGRRDLGIAPDRQSGFEMTLLRMLAFRPQAAPAAGSGGPAPVVASKAANRPTAERRPASKTGAGSVPGSETRPAIAVSADSGATMSWAKLIDAMGLKGVTRQLAANCILLGREEDVVSLQLDPGSKHLLTDKVRQNLQKELSRHFSTSVSLRIALNEPAQETPARLIARQESERLQQAKDALEQDPNIQALKATFGASIQEESVRPLDD